jgi:hypothetical protein
MTENPPVNRMQAIILPNRVFATSTRPNRNGSKNKVEKRGKK